VTWRQVGNFGFLLIIGIGYRLIGKAEPELEVGKTLMEGFRVGKQAAWLPAADWETLLTLPLEEVRKTLNITKPQAYHDTVSKYAELQTAGYVAAE
jgi:ubiquinone biosynthesis protein COQ4